MSSDTSDRAAKLPNRFVIAESDRSGSTVVSARADAMLIVAALALQDGDLASHDVFHDRFELGFLLGGAAADHHAGGFGTHLEAKLLVACLPRTLDRFVDGVLHLITGARDGVGDIQRIGTTTVGVAADDVRGFF